MQKFPSDADRKKDLEKQDYSVGRSSGQGCNSLTDSLLQLLLHFKVIKGPSADVNIPYWRHEACEAVRHHLCTHADKHLHPRLRNECNEVYDVSDDFHARAHLEHHKRARTIVYFFN